MTGIQVLNLFGYLPNMLELSANICTQGCTYCYAKYWKHEILPIDKVINSILSYETKKEGLLPFLIRKRRFNNFITNIFKEVFMLYDLNKRTAIHGREKKSLPKPKRKGSGRIRGLPNRF